MRKTMFLILVAVVSCFSGDLVRTKAIDWYDGLMYWGTYNDSALRYESPIPLVEWYYLNTFTIYKTDQDTNKIDSLILGEKYASDRRFIEVVYDQSSNEIIVLIDKPFFEISLPYSPVDLYMIVIDCETMEIVQDITYSESLRQRYVYCADENRDNWNNPPISIISSHSKHVRKIQSMIEYQNINLMGRVVRNPSITNQILITR